MPIYTGPITTMSPELPGFYTDDDLPRILIVGGESGRMRRFCHFIGLDFFQSVDALAVGVKGVHEMHSVRPC